MIENYGSRIAHRVKEYIPQVCKEETQITGCPLTVGKELFSKMASVCAKSHTGISHWKGQGERELWLPPC